MISLRWLKRGQLWSPIFAAFTTLASAVRNDLALLLQQLLLLNTTQHLVLLRLLQPNNERHANEILTYLFIPNLYSSCDEESSTATTTTAATTTSLLLLLLLLAFVWSAFFGARLIAAAIFLQSGRPSRLPTNIVKAFKHIDIKELECGPMPNLMAALSNIGGDLCSTP